MESVLCHRQFEIIPEKLFIVGMRTVFDDGFCTFLRALATQVGYTLLGDNDIHGMFAVVEMRNHRDDSTDLTFFGNRRTSEVEI